MTSKEFLESFDGMMKSDYGLPVLYLGGLGVAFSDILPTPNALLAKSQIDTLKKELDENKISEKEYNRSLEQYLITYKSVYYIGVLATMFFVDGDVYKKAKIGAMVLGAGAILGLIFKEPKVEHIPDLGINIDEPEMVNFDASKRKAQRRGRMIKFV